MMKLLPSCLAQRDTAWWHICQTVQEAERATGWRLARPGRHLRWDRAFIHTFGVTWKRVAVAHVEWQRREGEFISKVCKFLNLRELQDRYTPMRGHICPVGQPSAKKPRCARLLQMCGAELAHKHACQISIPGDNLAVAKWLRGCRGAKYNHHGEIPHRCLLSWDAVMHAALVLPPNAQDDALHHVYRDENAEAEALATQVHTEQLSSSWMNVCKASLGRPLGHFLICFFDEPSK